MEKNEETHTYEAYDKSKTFMRTCMARALLESQEACKGYYPVRTSWNKAVDAWNDFIDHLCMVYNQVGKDEDIGPLMETFEQECADFIRKENEVKNKLRYLRKEDKKDAERKAEANRDAGLETMSHAAESCLPAPGHAGGGQPEAAGQGRGRLCLPPGGDAGKEGSPQLPKAAVLCQCKLLCTPEAAEAAVLCQGGLCLPPGSDAGKEGSPRLPKAAVLCQGELLCTPEGAEAAVLCQGGRMVASESCLQASGRLCMPPPGHAGGGQPEAAVQGRGRLCLPPGGDAGKEGSPRSEGSPRLPKAAIRSQGGLLCTPEAGEAAVLCQAGLRMASESCLRAPRRTEPGEAAVQGQGALCLPPGGDAGKEGSPRLPKAAVLCQGGLLCTPEAADAEVLCGVYKIFKGQAVLALRR
jgi:hypothetical protein